MNEVGGFATIAICLALFAVGTVVVWPSQRKTRSSETVFFSLLCLTLALWVGANALSDIDTQHSLSWIHISFAATATALFSFLMFVNRFPTRKYISQKESIIHTTILFIMLVVIFSPSFIPEVAFKDGISNVIPGPLYPLFLLYVVSMLGLSLYRLGNSYRLLKGYYRTQVSYIFLGAVMMAAVAIITNLILPLFTGINDLYWVGSGANLLFVGAVAYAIARHRLFDIKRAVIRAIAYLMAIVTLLIIYGFTVFIGFARFIGLDSIPISQQLWFFVIATLIGLTIPVLVRFFDYMTRRIFFRNIYDPQIVLGKLGVIIENEVSIRPFAHESLQLLKHALNPEYIVLAVVDKNQKVTLYKDSKTLIDLDLVNTFMNHTNAYIDGHTENQEILDLMNKYSVAYSVCLDTSQRRFGCLILGYKQNGNNYSSADIDFITLFSDELGLAIQNILRIKEIQDFNDTLQVNIEEATSELRTINKKLRLLDESKDEFISMASHQLRTPLTSVKGYISMMLDGDIGEITSEQRKVLEEAYSSSQRMVYLIGDFLNISRLQTGKFEIEKSNIQLPLLIADEIDQLRASAQARDIVLDYTPPEQFPTLRLDENKIRQVMMNFIDNAIYYSKPGGGTITVTLAKHPKHVSFKVIDTGIGVPRSEQHQLFSKFYRASNAKKARPDGTGIGLFMAKKVVVAHEGAILFESTEGKGSTFGFRLPIE